MTAPGEADCGPENSQQTDASNRLHDSIFVSSDAPVYDVPMSVIHRPLPSSTDEHKVFTLYTLWLAVQHEVSNQHNCHIIQPAEALHCRCSSLLNECNKVMTSHQ